MTKKTIALFIALLLSGAATTIKSFAKPVNFQGVEKNSAIFTNHKTIYEGLEITSGMQLPSWEAFSTAMTGFDNLKTMPGKVKKNLLSVIDFSLPSTSKRFWVIDLQSNTVLFNDYVAHGRNSGNNVAKQFSNTPSSYSSSLGFYVTAETYHGKHGLSMRLDGVDKGFNDNARKRAIVVHGADYVSGDFIKKNGRLGRSLGCPSLPMGVHKDVINSINGGSVFFIYSSDADFMANSQILNSKQAA